jgi:hypothetical protein
MRRLILAAALLAGCGDNIKPETPDDAPMSDAAPDAPVQSVGPCLDRPTDLARPPAGSLPCDLLPPGFVVAP